MENSITSELIDEMSQRMNAHVGHDYHKAITGCSGSYMAKFPIDKDSSGITVWNTPKCKYCKSGHTELKYEGKMVLCLDCKAMSKR